MLDSVVAVVIGGASLYGGTGHGEGHDHRGADHRHAGNRDGQPAIPSHNRYIAIGGILVLAVLIDQFFPELVGRER